MKVTRSDTAAITTRAGKSRAGGTQVVVLTGDAHFDREVRQTFAASDQIALRVVSGVLSAMEADLDVAGATVVVVDMQADQAAEMAALERLTARVDPLPPIVVITQSFDAGVARTLLRMRVADFLIKPVSPVELVRTCARVARASAAANSQTQEAEILTFLPAVGGAGVTMLAVQSAIMLLNDTRRGKASSCLVDLDFQHGACADYLDLEPRLDLNEIEPRPERLDRQLLEVMLSHHSSGLAVVAAPNRPAEMRTFDPEMVTRLLDLVSSHFDHVVFDMPRTWFSWTDSVLLGSNRLFIVSEMTVPGLRHAKQLVEAVRERLADGPRPEVLINRFEQRLFSSGLRRRDIEQVLGDAFAGCIPNNYALVREAIDRGVPLDEVKPKNTITTELRKLMLSRPAAEPASPPGAVAGKKLKLALARG
jgi:pilus assembly protein CpaE